VSELIERPARRTAWAARALEEAAADLFRARRQGAPVGDAPVQLEHDATRVLRVARQIAAIQANPP